VIGTDSSNRGGALRLVTLGAPKPQSFELRERRVRIGSAPDNDIRLEEPTVSRRHALLERRWRRWRVVDLGSKNGTYINGRLVDASKPVRLKRRDELRLGNARFALSAAGEDAEGAAVAARSAKSSRRRFSWPAAAIAALVVFAGAFGLSEYLLNFSRLEQAAGVAQPSSATPVAKPAMASGRELPAGISADARAAERKAEKVSKATTAHLTAIGALAPGATIPPGETAPTDGAHLPWLARINHYRAMVSLSPVSDDSALSAGERDHTRYLVENYAAMIRNGVDLGAAMHNEDSGKPGYTPIGMRAGQQSDIDEWPGPNAPSSADWAIDDWMTGAFHRLNILNPELRQVAYGQWCKSGTCTAALNVIGGAEMPSFNGVPLPKPVMFPPPDSTVGLGPLWGEWPNPLSSCPGYKGPAGLPITLQVGMMTDAKLGDYSFAHLGKPPVKLAACGIDASSYTNPSSVAQQRGRDVLHDYGAVILIPRAPLKKGGTYAVSMTVNGRKYEWSFSIAR
jgi:pSer/pThr/pTyr-binding forkhead associated (FHA) protein/uncharacterized protein YkwD